MLVSLGDFVSISRNPIFLSHIYQPDCNYKRTITILVIRSTQYPLTTVPWKDEDMIFHFSQGEVQRGSKGQNEGALKLRARIRACAFGTNSLGCLDILTYIMYISMLCKDSLMNAFSDWMVREPSRLLLISIPFIGPMWGCMCALVKVWQPRTDTYQCMALFLKFIYLKSMVVNVLK